MSSASETKRAPGLAKRIRTLTVRQPHAWAIVQGHKIVENRSRSTKIRGRIAIHAGLAYDHEARVWMELGAQLVVPGKFAQGAIIGEVTLTNCVPRELVYTGRKTRDLERQKWASEDAGGGAEWCWLLAEAVAYDEPIPARGKLGFWWPK